MLHKCIDMYSLTITSLRLGCRVYTQKVIVGNILGYILKIFSVCTGKVIVSNILRYILNIFSVYTQKVIVSNILGNILNIFSVCTEKLIVSEILGYILDTNLLNGFFHVYGQKPTQIVL